jgi:hypothetical protein
MSARGNGLVGRQPSFFALHVEQPTRHLIPLDGNVALFIVIVDDDLRWRT